MTHAPRRNADGSLDIGHYRRRARRLRYLARRQAMRRLCSAAAALGDMVALAVLPARAVPPGEDVVIEPPRVPHDASATPTIGGLAPAD